MEPALNQKSLVELLNEDESEDEFICQHCSFVGTEEFRYCPSCKRMARNPTMSEWGKQLPIGVEQEDSSFLKTFVMKDPQTKLRSPLNVFLNALSSFFESSHMLCFFRAI